VDQVVLPFTVVDRKGRIGNGLEQSQFRVYEDGKQQQLRFFSHRDVPVTVGLVIDNSGSMGPKRPDTVLAALHFVRLSNPDDEMFVVNFNEHVSLGLPESEQFTSNAQDLRDALLSHPCAGKTALFDAIVTGLEHLQQGSRDKKALIVVSDGGDNASRHSFRDVLDLAQKSNVIIYTVGLFDEADMDQHPDILKKLAHATGGEVFLPDRSSQIAGVCGRIAHDLRNQYTLAYTPANDRHDGHYRRVEVVVFENGHKLNARTRPGYFAPGSGSGRASR
jgi:VWFA-related protein